jgi:hypothetical protein
MRSVRRVALQVVKMKLYLFPPSPRVLGITRPFGVVVSSTC